MFIVVITHDNMSVLTKHCFVKITLSEEYIMTY